MPPDVFLMLASSGLGLVASLMFFVSEDRPPEEPVVDDQRKPQLSFCMPPHRARLQPPPLPRPMRAWCEVNFTASSVMTFRPTGEEWEITLDVVPVADAPAMQVQNGDASGSVHDLRWHGKAGLPKPVRRTWRQKPGRA